MANTTFIAGGRRRKLYRRKPGGPWHVRFEHNGSNIVRSLGTTVDSAAKERARQIIEAEMVGDNQTSRRLKVKSDYCTLRQVCDIYLEKFGKDARTKRTARGNIGCLEKIVRIGGNSTLEARATILTAGLIRAFEAEDEKRIERDGKKNVLQESELRIRTSIGSVVRQARSIFKKSHMSWFGELSLPELTEFRDQGVTSPDRPRPRPLDDGVMDQVNAAAPILAQQDPACYVSHLLFKFLGMRNAEQKFARRCWIVRDAKGGGKLGVIYRPEEGFKPKKKTEGWIPIAPSVLAELDRYYHPSPDGDFLVPAEHKSARAEIIDDRHSAWAGQWIQGRSKTSYELRRYAGSIVFRKSGNLAHVQQFLRHADLKTTMDWYWYLLDELPAIDMHDVPQTNPDIAVVA